MNKKIAFIAVTLFVLIAALTAQKSPDDFLGVQVGADQTLVKYPGIIKYFKYLDDQSGRLKLSDEGLSTQGNPMYLAFISSERNIGQLERLAGINKKLANPDTLKPGEAKELIDEAKVFVLITCGIHATEIAATQMVMRFAHKLVTSNSPEVKEYLDKAVLLVMPSINPDGNIMVTEWYEKYLGSEYEGGRMPYLYHLYAGHDTNRDFYMLNLKETRVVNAVLHHRYFPHIFLDMHQMGSTGPRMFVPPFYNPVNQNLDPLLTRETDIVGSFMALKLQENEKKGVASSYGFDAYWPGGSKNTAWYKNVVGILTELASARVASPIFIDPNELRVSSKGLPEYKAQVNFPAPWAGGWWRLQDIIDYEFIAVEALLEVAAKNRKSFLSNFYKMGMDCVEKGKTDAPFAYVIPPDQWDTTAAYDFLMRMQEHGVRIFSLDSDAQVDNYIYPKGSFVIPLAQPYRSFIKVMMERQRYPEVKHMRNGPVIRPYDASGWTMTLQMGVKSIELNSPLVGVNLSPAEKLDFPEPALTGEGNYYRIPARFNRSAIAVNRLLKKGVTVFRFTAASSSELAPGDFLVNTVGLKPVDLHSVLKGTGVAVDMVSLGTADQEHLKELVKPRIGIYQSYRASMDEGWTRWVLDTFEFSYQVLHNKDFLDKKFAGKYDVIIIPDLGRETIVNGVATGYRAYYAKSTPPEFKGGIGKKGVEALKTFVKGGGTLVLMDSAAELGSKDFSLPFYDIMNEVKREDFYCPGSILRIHVDSNDPIGWGMEEDNIIYFSHSPAFRTRLPLLKSINRKVVARFGELGPHLLSGYLSGGQRLNRAAAIMRFDYHDGGVIVLGGRVQHRAQTFGTFKFLFNAVYY
jgi:hypothetical protein